MLKLHQFNIMGGWWPSGVIVKGLASSARIVPKFADAVSWGPALRAKKNEECRVTVHLGKTKFGATSFSLNETFPRGASKWKKWPCYSTRKRALRACSSMATFFCLLEKKWWARERRVKNFQKKRATNFELFGQLLPFLFSFLPKTSDLIQSPILWKTCAGPTSGAV